MSEAHAFPNPLDRSGKVLPFPGAVTTPVTKAPAPRRRHTIGAGGNRVVVPAVTIAGRSLLYSVTGTSRGAVRLWRWVRADEYREHLAAKPELVEKVRHRRRRTLAWGTGTTTVGLAAGTVAWSPTPWLAGSALLVTASASEWWRRRPTGDDGPAIARGRMGSRAVREAFAAAKLGTARVVGPVARDGDAWACVVELPPGVPASKAVRRRAEVASAFGVDFVQVAMDPVTGHAGRVALMVFDSDPYTGQAPAHPLLAHTGPWNLWTAPVPVGTDARRRPVGFSLAERSLLIGGEPGGGKSVAANNVLAAAALDPHCELWLANGKGSADLMDWEPLAVRSDPEAEPGVYLEMIRDLAAEMDRRYALLRRLGERKLTAEVADGEGLPMVLFHADELAFYVAADKAIGEALRDLVARGRAAGIVTSVATQRPSADVVPTSLRDLLSVRLALRCTTPQASDTILGQGWAGRGHNAAMISAEQRGLGVLLAEGTEPVMVRGHYLTDTQVSAIAKRARALRAEAGTLPVLDTDPRRVLLARILDVAGDRDKVASAELVDRLDDVPDAETLAARLRPLGLTPGALWIDSKTLQGYRTMLVREALDRL